MAEAEAARPPPNLLGGAARPAGGGAAVTTAMLITAVVLVVVQTMPKVAARGDGLVGPSPDPGGGAAAAVPGDGRPLRRLISKKVIHSPLLTPRREHRWRPAGMPS